MRYIAVALIALTVVVAGCSSTSTEEELPEETPKNNPDTTGGEEENVTTVTHTSSGFQPSTVTIEQGETVRWESEAGSMWVASDQHPSHTEYSGTSRSEHCTGGEDAFDQCTAGSEYSFTFEKTGEWSYHNHENSFQGGTVMVE